MSAPCPSCGAETEPRANIDMTFAMFRSGFCGHLTNPSVDQIDQIEQARAIIDQISGLSFNDVSAEIAKELALAPCQKACCKPREKKAAA